MFRKTSFHFRLALFALVALAASAGAEAISDPYFRVAAHSTNRHNIYIGVNDNWLYVTGDGSTDLDCWVYDSDGRLVDSDTDLTDDCVLETPGIGQHRLVVTNLGAVWNDYRVSKGE